MVKGMVKNLAQLAVDSVRQASHEALVELGHAAADIATEWLSREGAEELLGIASTTIPPPLLDCDDESAAPPPPAAYAAALSTPPPPPPPAAPSSEQNGSTTASGAEIVAEWVGVCKQDAPPTFHDGSSSSISAGTRSNSNTTATTGTRSNSNTTDTTGDGDGDGADAGTDTPVAKELHDGGESFDGDGTFDLTDRGPDAPPVAAEMASRMNEWLKSIPFPSPDGSGEGERQWCGSWLSVAQSARAAVYLHTVTSQMRCRLAIQLELDSVTVDLLHRMQI